MYSKETFVIDRSIKPFKFAKFELSGSISYALKRGKARLNLTRLSAVASPWEHRGQGGQGGTAPPPFLADQLTLSQPGRGGGADYAQHNIKCPPS